MQVDRGILRLSEDDIEANGTGTCRRYTAATVRKAALLHALMQAGLQPKAAGRVDEQIHRATVTPGDLIVADRNGVAEITSSYRPSTNAAVVLDVGTLFAELDRSLAAA
jgi:hypothetical protein